MACVYSHHKICDNSIFYIGISKNSDGSFKRAFDNQKRSIIWKRIVKKYSGFNVTIIADNISWEEAIKMEIDLISKYGRINNKTGVLCNLTDGGEGCLGFVITEEYRAKLSQSLKGKNKSFGDKNHFYGKKHTKETREKISQSLRSTTKNKGINNHNFGKKYSPERKLSMSINRTGKKHSIETIEKIKKWGTGRPKSEEWKESVSGCNHPKFGKGHLILGGDNPNSKKCILIETGEIFNSLIEACKKLDLSYSTQRIYLNKNKANRKFNYI